MSPATHAGGGPGVSLPSDSLNSFPFSFAREERARLADAAAAAKLDRFQFKELF